MRIAYSDDYVSPSTDRKCQLAVPGCHRSDPVIWTSACANHRAHQGQTTFHADFDPRERQGQTTSETNHVAAMLDIFTGDGARDVLQQEQCDDLAADADVMLNGHDQQAAGGDVESDVMSAYGDLADVIDDQQTVSEVLYSVAKCLAINCYKNKVKAVYV